MAGPIFKQNLRSVLISEKNGIEISRLNKEYYDLIGCNLPYDRKLYPTLESYLLTLSDTCQLRRYGSQTMVLPVVSEKQQKLSELIQGQKSAKKSFQPRRALLSTRCQVYNSQSSSRLYVKRNTGYTNQSTNPIRLERPATNYSNDRKATSYNKTRSNRIIDKENFGDKSSGGKAFDVRAQNGNSNIKVIESKASNFVRKESKTDQSIESKATDHTRRETNRRASIKSNANTRKSPFKTTETKLNIKIFDDEPVDYKYELSMFALENNLAEPKYVLSNYVEKYSKVLLYFSKVQIGQQSWLIYPDCCYRTADGADCGVAKKALNDLKAQKKTNDASPTTDQADIVNKIMKFFEQEKDPLYSTHIESLFLSTYNSKLDENWLNVLKESKKFDVETITIGRNVLVLVVPSVEKKKSEDTNTQADLSKDASEDSLVDQLNSTNLEECEIQELPESLELRKEDWQVMILRATNSREIVLRLTNNTNKLDELITDLQRFYNEEKLGEQAEEVVIGRIYAAVFDGAVFRVQPILLEGKDVFCWFLDDGITEKIGKSNLYEINQKFMKLPFQAFTVQLDGLKSQSESLIRKFIDDKMKENNDALCLIARPASFEEPITVRLYDTSKDDQDIDLNEAIIEFINSSNLPGSSSAISKAVLPKLSEEDDEYELMNVKVSFVQNPHSFIVTSLEHLDQESKYQQLNNQLQNFYSKSDEHVELNHSMIYPGLFVCVKDTNAHWYRARVDDLNGSSKCTCYLVDEGRIVLTEIKNIQPLYSQFLEVPMIAIRAAFSNIVPINQDWNIDDIIAFKNLVDGNEFVAMVQDIVTIDSEIIMQLSELNSKGGNVSDILVNSKHAKIL